MPNKDGDLWWPDHMKPPLTEAEKSFLREVYAAVQGIGFFGATDECDFIEVLAITMRRTRERWTSLGG